MSSILKEKRATSLLPEEVECRIDTVGPGSITLVFYSTARCVMSILDELFGLFGWKKEIREIPRTAEQDKFAAICKLTITDPKSGVAIVREDVGEDDKSYKAAASDALKRAAMNVIPSIRALYDIPACRISAGKLGLSLTNPNNKDQSKQEMKTLTRYMKFAVNNISFRESATGIVVKTLQVVNQESGDIVLEYVNDTKIYKSTETEHLKAVRKKMILAGVTEAEIEKSYGQPLEDVIRTEREFDALMRRLDLTIEKKAARESQDDDIPVLPNQKKAVTSRPQRKNTAAAK